MNDDEFQQSIAALDVLRVQIDSAVKQSQFLQVSLEEMFRTRETFSALASAKEGDEILAPVGMSSFIRAKVTDSKLVVVGVGNKISVDMDTEDAAKYMASNIEKTSEVIKKLSSAIEEMDSRARTLAAVIQQEYQRRQQ